MIPLVTLSVALGVSVLLVIFWPLLEFKAVPKQQKDILRRLEVLLFEKERYLTNLKDLELDRNMQKISETDYQELRSQLLNEASQVYVGIEEIEKSSFIRKIEADALGLESGETL